MLTFEEWYKRYYLQPFDWFSTPTTEADAIRIYTAFVRMQQLQQREYIGEI